MNKKAIQTLVKESYVDESLDEKKVKAIADKLIRQDLKKYINALKECESRNNLIITVPFSQNEAEIFENLKNIFHTKKIIIRTDSMLMLGMKIINKDLIYEYSLKNILENIVIHVNQNYD